MSERTRQHVDMFWELVDEILNALLFVLIGLEVLVLTFTRDLLLAGLVAIPVLLLARWISVGLPVVLLRAGVRLPAGRPDHDLGRAARRNFRGAGAFAAGRPRAGNHPRAHLLLVVFSIVIQGLSFSGLFVRRAMAGR